MKKIVAFLDTNIFLHYQPFDQVNWLNELGSTEVDIAIAPIVIRELDHHKDQHSNFDPLPIYVPVKSRESDVIDPLPIYVPVKSRESDVI